MKCNKIQKLLSSYIDNELKKEQMNKIEEHLRQCRDCQSILADLKMTVDMVGSLKDSDTPVDLMEGIYQKIAEKNQIKRVRVSPWVRIPLEGLVVALAGLLVVYVSQLYLGNDTHLPKYTPDESPVSEKVAGTVARKHKKDGLIASKETLAKLETADKISGVYEKRKAESPAPARILQEDFALSLKEEETIKAQYEFFINVMNINESLDKINTLTGNMDGRVIDVVGEDVLLQVPAYNYPYFVAYLEEVGSFSNLKRTKTKAPSSISKELKSAPTREINRYETTPVIIRIQLIMPFDDNSNNGR